MVLDEKVKEVLEKCLYELETSHGLYFADKSNLEDGFYLDHLILIEAVKNVLNV